MCQGYPGRGLALSQSLTSFFCIGEATPVPCPLVSRMALCQTCRPHLLWLLPLETPGEVCLFLLSWCLCSAKLRLLVGQGRRSVSGPGVSIPRGPVHREPYPATLQAQPSVREGGIPARTEGGGPVGSGERRWVSLWFCELQSCEAESARKLPREGLRGPRPGKPALGPAAPQLPLPLSPQVHAGPGQQPARAVRLGHQRPHRRDGQLRPATAGGAGAPGENVFRQVRP